MSTIKERFIPFIQALQQTICKEVAAIDGKSEFHIDHWERPEGGGGITAVIEKGNVFEKGGVATSVVHGELPEVMRKHLGVEEAQFMACGISLILHPISPLVPTVHANFRYFEMYGADGTTIVDSWFGGGADLTPYYLDKADATHFHQVFKTTCDRHNSNHYSDMKAHCDRYFRNTHRNESRGIGGIFYDYHRANETTTMEQHLAFQLEIAESFLPAYLPIVLKNKDLAYNDEQKYWQEIRRGRYVEFNLLHDRGTLFGLRTNGRMESILMSLPPTVRWDYNHQPKENSPEAELLAVLKNPVEWL